MKNIETANNKRPTANTKNKEERIQNTQTSNQEYRIQKPQTMN